MLTAVVLDVNIYAFCIMLMLFVILQINMDVYAKAERHLRRMLIWTMLLLAAEYLGTRHLAWVSPHISSGAMIFLYLLYPGLIWEAANWLILQLVELPPGAPKYLRLIRGICLLDVALSLLSLWTGWYYRLDMETATYSRGPFFLLHFALLVGSLLGVYGYLIAYRRHLLQHNLAALLFFPIPAILGGFVLLIGRYSSFEAEGVAFSLLSVFINVQSRMIGYDPETQAIKRKNIEIAIRRAVRDILPGTMLAVFIVRLESAPALLRLFGAETVREAKQVLVNILQQSGNRKDVIGCYGDYAFAILREDVRDSDEITQIVRRIERSAEEYGLRDDIGYDFQVRVACDVYDSEMTITAGDFIRRLDKRLIT